MYVLAICAGTGALELGIHLAEPSSRVVCYVEREAFAVKTLVEQMEAGWLDTSPIWSDIGTFDGRSWRGVVDCITGGYPCQPFSFAGKRRGVDDPRHLWPSIRRIVEEVFPEWCFFENVPGHLSMGFETVADDLEGMGYTVAAGLFAAAEVGASQRRERLFIMAHSGRLDCSGRGESRDVACSSGTTEGDGEQRERMRNTAGDGGSVVADSIGPRSQGWPMLGGDGREKFPAVERVRGDDMAYRTGSGWYLPSATESEIRGQPDEQSGPLAALETGGFGCLSLFPPGPGDIESWERILAVRPDLEPAIRRVADGLADRVDRLRSGGNGVCPLVAAHAFLALRDSLRI